MEKKVRLMFDRFVGRIKEEQRKRDKDMYPGSFVESAVIEHLHRYWLESVLYSMGAENIYREVQYPRCKKSKMGRASACDLKAAFSTQKECWVEIKLAYEDTRYSIGSFTRDLEKLKGLNDFPETRSAAKVFLMVCYMCEQHRQLPGKFGRLDEIAEKDFKAKKLDSVWLSFPSPTHWRDKKKWANVTHAQVRVMAYLLP